MPDLTAKQDENLRKIAAAEDAERARMGDRAYHFPGFQGRGIAKILWPDSPAWEQRTRFHAAANNSQGSMGGTMPMNGARRARELEDKGMLFCTYTDHGLPQFRVSERGRRYLEENHG